MSWQPWLTSQFSLRHLLLLCSAVPDVPAVLFLFELSAAAVLAAEQAAGLASLDGGVCVSWCVR
jgi:hypothetical protein